MSGSVSECCLRRLNVHGKRHTARENVATLERVEAVLKAEEVVA